ncbi:MFS transporter [Moorena sp. SIO4A5]|uniref:MFS transporter n=1 Tax=Moorena sp. SIO4A5 TaxID=2607838 RepID=UPI0013CDB6B1|nr:MFS transporter [Moorena sp. SIO4A5]
MVVIYLTFIALGLPDTILGVAWPSMRSSLFLPLEAAGIITMLTTICTAFSSFASGLLLHKLGTGKVVFISTLLSASALFGYSLSPSFWWLLLCTLPLGVGAGAIDTGINHFVALKYSPRHMNWLHSFWGIGAFLGPSIITLYVADSGNWRGGYQMIAAIVFVIAAIIGISISLSLWRSKSIKEENTALQNKAVQKKSGLNLIRQQDVFLSIIAFPIYIAVEMGVGVWLASYLIEGRGLDKLNVGLIISLFYISIMIGRLIAGIFANNISIQKLMNMGLCLMFIGSWMLIIQQNSLLVPSIILLGIGCAPIFPSMIHNTPKLFGEINSQEITGYQVGGSYLSGVLILPVMGLLSSKVSLEVIPITICLFVVLLAFIVNLINRHRSQK